MSIEVALRRWERFWFGEGSLVRLAVFRIVMLVAALHGVVNYRRAMFQVAQESTAAYVDRRWDPILALELLGAEPVGMPATAVVYGALLAAIALGILGLFTRTACAVAAVLTFLWIGGYYSLGQPHHDCVPLVFGLFALPFAPVGARLSLDAAWSRRRGRGGEAPLAPPERAPYAALPLRLTQVTIAIGYFFSGASKLAIGGLGWMNGYTLQGIMLEFGEPPWGLGDRVALCAFLSVGLVVAQLTFPLVFAARRLRWFYVPMAVVFHFVSSRTMATGSFFTLWITLSSFVALERVPAFCAERLVRRGWLSRLVWAPILALATFHVLRTCFEVVPGVLALGLVPPFLLAARGGLRAARAAAGGAAPSSAAVP